MATNKIAILQKNTIQPVLIFMVLLTGACSGTRNDVLHIAAAANVQFAMDSLVKAFTSKSGYEAEIILGSSGKLTAQIQQGAPFDVFVSADMKYPQALYLSGYSTQPPRVYAIGNLVIWSMFEDLTLHLDSLSKPKIKHIAIANPKTAPYGMAALEFIEKQGYMDVFMPKLVYGENIAQTNQFIISKTAEAGFTAKSVVMASSMRNRGKWINVPDSLYTPIQQGAVIIQRKGGISESAKTFYNFLYSTDAKAILKRYGYTTLHKQ